MPEITDANDCIVKIGSSQAGGTAGALIIDDFELEVNPNNERKWGVGNQDAKGRTSGNREINLSFSHIGQNEDLAEDIDNGNFDVVLSGNLYSWEVDDVDGSFTTNVSDGGDYTIDFDGNGLGYERVSN